MGEGGRVQQGYHTGYWRYHTGYGGYHTGHKRYHTGYWRYHTGFKQPDPRYPKTPLLAYGVQWYGCLGRHPRTQTILFGIVQFKHPHPRYPNIIYIGDMV